MKTIALYISTIIFLFSCSNVTENQKAKTLEYRSVNSIHDKKAISKKVVDSLKKESSEYILSNEVLQNGKYRFDIAFAEWDGKSMCEKVTVLINGSSIQVIYEGDGKLSQTKKGEVLDQGKIMKHKSGVWIIGNSLSDTQLDEIGGCTGGPTIIDFKNKKYWMC
ncbi:MAG: hypothetical protein WC150_05855 [Bacteroidia bacterium]